MNVSGPKYLSISFAVPEGDNKKVDTAVEDLKPDTDEKDNELPCKSNSNSNSFH